MIRRRLCASLVALFLAAAPAQAGAEEPLHFSTPITYGTHLPGLGKPVKDWAAEVGALSGGTLSFDIEQPGQNVMPQDILDAVSKGTAAAGFSKAEFWANRLPAAALFSGFPFGPDAKTYAAWFYAGNGLTLYQHMYDDGGFNVHVLPCAFGGAETAGWFAKELKSPEDIERLRIRIFGQGGLVMQKLGASPALVPGSKLNQAFQDGDIDAAELYPPPVDARTDLAGAVKRIYLPGWQQPETVMELLINKDRWNALDDQQQLWIETACRDTMFQTMSENPVLAAKALSDFADQGVTIETLPAPVLDRLHQTWDEIAAQQGKHDPFFSQVLDDIRKFRAEIATPGAVAPMAGASSLEPPMTSATE
ncbi:C4-dicarboxylate ABC transporter [Methyloligella sp. 2.7D]|uniref:TRAP transporter substrate-binding protein n=1 Tax=unclassified Methyloligella TaxID=2625955 RepID=UPI00157CAB88|nr:C4-dicarboxylate ABC transporter [Methyloligella sp. GL2]QKP78375.1 C4-dicarboxylate ABC transporter [Methyloligella sp. GL2]